MTILGRDTATGDYVGLGAAARSRGVYVIGATGTGKTTFLQSIAYQDMQAGHGLCVLDPHGDMIDFLLPRVPPERVGDVILFDPADVERPFGLNLLECDRTDAQQVRWVVSTLLVTLKRLFAASWGPRLEHVLGHTLWTAMTIPNATLVEVLLLLTDTEYQLSQVRRLTEPLLVNFWRDFPKKQSERHELVSSTVNKLTPFLLDSGMRNIVGQPTSTIDLREMMDNRQIVLVNLSKGDLGENNSSLLGAVLINLILIAALSRRNLSPEARLAAPFHVLVDEYQNFASESFAVLQSEARKYAVDLVVAHQYRDQLDLINQGAALNVGNFVCFRVTGVDGPELASQFDNTPPVPEKTIQPVYRRRDKYADQRTGEPFFVGIHTAAGGDTLYREVDLPRRMYSDVQAERANTLSNLPPFHAQVKVIEDAGERQFQLTEYTVAALDPHHPTDQAYFGTPDPAIAAQIRDRSRARASERAAVEAFLRQRTGGHADFSVPPASGRVSRER